MSVKYQISVNPFTGETNKQVETYDEMVVDQIIKKSKTAQKIWSGLSISERLKRMEDFKSLILKNQKVLAELITKEIGCPISQTMAEVKKTASIIDYYAKNAEKFLQDEIVSEDNISKNYIKYMPIGTILHVSPYNYPLYLALRPIIPALIAGNTAILKTPSNTPLLAQKLIEIINDSGLEDGVLDIILIGGSDVEKVIANPIINLVTIIGSERAGRSVAKTAGQYIKKSILELGGSDPFVVFEDADIDKAVEGATFSRLRNAGQSCNAAKRFLVQNSIKDEFIVKLKKAFEEQKYGSPLDETTQLSPISTSKGLNEALEQINDAVNKGAKVVTGGNHVEKFGFMLEPTILSDITSEMRVYNEETFSPIAPVIGFDTVEEAIQIANDSKLGLGASVWTSDTDISVLAINSLEVGNVFINSVVRGNIAMPYGGIKNSGYGREFSEVGIKEFTNIKTVVEKK